MREFVIQRYNKYNQLLQEIGLRIERDKITVNELRNLVISKYPNNFKENNIVQINGYCPILESYIKDNVKLIKFFENEEKEDNNNQNNFNEELNENQEYEEREYSNEESESDEDLCYKKTLDELIKSEEKKKLSKKRKREENNNYNDNTNQIKNIIKFDEKYEIISDFAPTRREVLKALFENDNNKIKYKTNNYKKKYLNPEKYAQNNNIENPFFNGETLVLSLNFPNENNNFDYQEFAEKIKIEEKKEEEKSKIKKNKVEVEKKGEEIEKKNEKKIEEENKIRKKEIRIDFYFNDKLRQINRKEIRKILYDFYNLKYPNFSERIEFSKLIDKIIQLEPQNKKKKLNFVFDLDNTLICAFNINNNINFDKIKEKYLNENYIFDECYSKGFENMKFIIHIREGIKSLFDKIKDIGNLFIYTMSIEPYANMIKKHIEKFCNIKFENMIFYDKKNHTTKNKFLQYLNLNENNTLILDDREEVWNGDKIREKCVINSMFYLSEKAITFANETFTEKKQKKNITPFFYNITTNNWLNNKMAYVIENPFKDYISERALHIENENSNKKQLEYIGIIYRTVYNILDFMDFGNILPMEAVNMIRKTIFAGMIFDISSYKSISYVILKDLIISNGGEISINFKYIDEANYVYICNIPIFKEKKENINNKKIRYKNFFVVNEKYIFDCALCMVKLPLNAQEYQINI